jgi:hypothetical protein
VSRAGAVALALLVAWSAGRDARAQGAASAPAAVGPASAPVVPGPASAPALPPGLAGPLAAGPLRLRYQPAVAAQARRLAAEAPALCARVAADLGVPPPAADVALVLRARDLPTGLPAGHRPPPWATGVTYPREGLIAIATASPDGTRQHLPTLLKHEYSHLALAHAAGFRPVPRWFVEGFAHVQAGERSFGRAQTLAYAAAAGRLQPLHRLERGFPLREDLASLAYAQAYDFVGYLKEKHGAAGLERLLRGVAAGDSFDDAFRVAYRRTIFAMERDWQLDVRRRYVWLPLLTSGTGLWMLLSVLAVVAFVRRRRRQRERLARMEAEERPPRVWN